MAEGCESMILFFHLIIPSSLRTPTPNSHLTVYNIALGKELSIYYLMLSFDLIREFLSSCRFAERDRGSQVNLLKGTQLTRWNLTCEL